MMALGCHDIDILSLTIRLTDTLGYIRLILIYLYISGCTLTISCYMLDTLCYINR